MSLLPPVEIVAAQALDPFQPNVHLTVEYDTSRVSPQQIADAVNRLGYEATLPTRSGG